MPRVKNKSFGWAVGSISAVSRVRSLILPEERRLHAWPVDLVCDAIGKLIIYASPMSLEVKPVSSFFVYWLKIVSSTPEPTQMTFEIVFRYISVHCDMQLTFFDLRMDAPKKWYGKVCDLPYRISSVLNVPLSNINVGGYICNERSYWDLKPLEDAKSLQQQSLKEEFTTNNRTKRCVPSDSRISPTVSAPSKSLRHAMDQGRTFCFDLIISATIFARRKSAGGNMIGLNQQRKSHASSRSFGRMNAGSFSRTAAGDQAY